MMQVRLIGYCIEGSLFLVYEYIENGNLSQYLRSSSGEEDSSQAQNLNNWLVLNLNNVALRVGAVAMVY